MGMQEIDIVPPFPVDGVNRARGARQRASANDDTWPNCDPRRRRQSATRIDAVFVVFRQRF